MIQLVDPDISKRRYDMLGRLFFIGLQWPLSQSKTILMSDLQ